MGSRIEPDPRIIDRRVGEGGVGAVYAGLHLVRGVPAAIKVVRLAAERDTATRADQLERFLHEGRLLSLSRRRRSRWALVVPRLVAESSAKATT